MPEDEEMPGGWEISVIAYDRSGEEIWRTQHGTGEFLVATNVVIDEVGGILSVAGCGRAEVDWGSPEGPDMEYKAVVLTWDMTGVFLGSVFFGTDKEDAAQGMCYSADGQSYYVTGTTYGLLGEESYGERDAFIGELTRLPRQQDADPISPPEPARE